MRPVTIVTEADNPLWVTGTPAAAGTAVTVFGPYAGRIDAVVLGGDRRTMAVLRADQRLGDDQKAALIAVYQSMISST